MSGSEKTPARPTWIVLLIKLTKGLLYTILVFLSLLMLMTVAMGSTALLEVPVHLLIGWMFYLVEVVPQTRINPELLLSSSAALLLGIAGLQWLMRKFCDRNHWPWRFTLAWCGILVVMFGTSIAAVGIVHQTGWLFRMPAWIEMGGMATQMKAMSNAKQVVLAAKQYASAHDGKFPESCAELMPEIVTDSRIFWASVDRNMPAEPLVYAGAGMRDTDYGNLLVVWSPRASANGWRVIARLDGSAEVVREEKFQEMLAAFRERLFLRGTSAKLPR
jgi:hypothetical protein